MNSRSPYFGEIIESSSLEWKIASWDHNNYPALGACIIIEHKNQKLCACTSHITTGSNEAHRTPQPLQKDSNELAREYPHIYSFLQTNITANPLGYITDNDYHSQPSPYIPPIHTFVRPANIDELKQIINTNTPFNLLFCAHQPPFLDTLILAVVTQYVAKCGLSQNRAAHLARSFARSCPQDTLRIQTFITALEPLISQELHV